MYLASCTNTHCDVTDSVNHGMFKNAKTWISWERNIIFLRNKKTLNLCLRWHILRSYHFVAEVTFKRFFRRMVFVQWQCQSKVLRGLSEVTEAIWNSECTWAFRGHLGAWALGRHSKGTQAPGYLRHTGTRALRHSGTWAFGHLGTWTPRQLGQSDNWSL